MLPNNLVWLAFLKQTAIGVDLTKRSKNEKRIQNVDEGSQNFQLPVRCLSEAPFSPVCSLSACFRIMKLCHILFKVRLIQGDSEPLIYCHNADVFVLSVTMALLCVGLPRARCTQGWLVNQSSDSDGEAWCKTKACVRLDRVKPVTQFTVERCYTAGDAELAGALYSTVYMAHFNMVLRCAP